MKIDESWGNVKPARIDDVQASLRRNVVFDSGDRSVENSQVSSLAKTTARISHFTISDQEVIPFCFLRVASAPYEDCGSSGQHLEKVSAFHGRFSNEWNGPFEEVIIWNSD